LLKQLIYYTTELRHNKSHLPQYRFYAILPFSFMIRSQRLERVMYSFACGCSCHIRNMRCKTPQYLVTYDKWYGVRWFI